MARKTKDEQQPRCSKVSYDLPGWEGGIAVFWMEGEYGTIVVAIPRLGVSSLLLGNPSDLNGLIRSLQDDVYFRHNWEEATEFAEMILQDIRRWNK